MMVGFFSYSYCLFIYLRTPIFFPVAVIGVVRLFLFHCPVEERG